MLHSPQILLPPRPAGGGGASLDAATTAWINAVKAANSGVDSVSPTQKTNVNTLIVALKGHSLFTKLDRLWLWTGESDHHQAMTDIINPGVGVVTENGNLTTGLTSGGYTGDGTTGFFDTGFNPSTGTPNYTAASATAGTYIVTNRTSGGGQFPFGADQTNQCIFEGYRFGAILANIHGASMGGASPGGTNGFWALTQLTGNATCYNRSSTLSNPTLAVVQTVANASPSGVPATNFYGVAENAGGSAASFDGASDTIGTIFFGLGLNSTDLTNLSNDLNTYMTAWGKNQY